jgi:hypothetical protein
MQHKTHTTPRIDSQGPNVQPHPVAPVLAPPRRPSEAVEAMAYWYIQDMPVDVLAWKIRHRVIM